MTLDVHDPLQQLVLETCRHPPGSLARQRNMTRLIRQIIQSGKLWREDTPYYEDALQQTWLFFCRNLCEATTTQPYNPERSSVTTWLDHYLKRRLQDYRIASYQEAKQMPLDGQIAPVLAAPTHIPPILEDIQDWVREDRDRQLSCTCLSNRPEVNCQMLILRRLPPRTAWEELAREFDVPTTTLNSFYRRKCFPCLRKFGESQGYL